MFGFRTADDLIEEKCRLRLPTSNRRFRKTGRGAISRRPREIVDLDHCRTTNLNRAPRSPGSSGAPALLVSVRNAAEAVAALEGGCEILDIKDPSRGPLGMAASDEIAAIVTARNAVSNSVPVSAALGELHEWEETTPVPRLGPGISFLKFGTSRLSAHHDLCRAFASFRSRFVAQSNAGEFDVARRGWIAVAYADWQAAKAPPPRVVAEGAIAAGCEGVLIDTYDKSSGGLFDALSILELKECAAIVRQAGKAFALAGRLRIDDVERAIDLRPDIIGIRSAACRQGRRDLEIDADAVRQFRQGLAPAGGKALRGSQLSCGNRSD